MLKKSKSKLKPKIVHFDEKQITEKKKSLSKSSEKFKIKSSKSINKVNVDDTSRLSNASSIKKTSLEDFTCIKLLGSGAYAEVVLVKHNLNGKIYALKKVNKNMLNHFEKQHEVHIEKQCLVELKHINILKLHKTFQDKKHIYFVLEYCINKDLAYLLKIIGKIDFYLAQFFAAQLLSAISYMHKQGIYHRDVKPENIGLDKYMNIKLFDFATAVKLNNFFDKKYMRFIELNPEEKKYLNEQLKNNENEIEHNNNIIKINEHKILLLERLFVGTPEYVSPEVLEHKYDIIGPSVDIWAFGVILYLLFMGKTPFKAKTEQEILDNIKNVRYDFIDEEENNKNKIPEEAKDLISKILIKDPSKRIGYNSYDYLDIKNHPFFKGINFDNLENDQTIILKNKNYLEKFGYHIEKIENEEERHLSLIQELYGLEEPKNEIIDIKATSAKNISDIGGLINNLKEVANEYNNNNINDSENKSDDGNNEDKILLEEKLLKKSPWFHYNTRIVIFYSKGHIDYFEPNTKKRKGSFIINSKCKANIIDDYRFEVQTPNRNYIFKHKTKKVSNEWVDVINKFIKKLSKKDKK